MMEMQTTTEGGAMAPLRPKLEDIESQDGSMDAETKVAFQKKRTLFTRIIQGGAIAAIIVNILAMALEWSVLMFFAGLMGVGVGSGVVYFQNQLRGEDTLRTVQNELRHKVNDFAEENDNLTATVSNLQGELVPLKQTEEELRVLAEKNGMSVDKLAGLVKTNKVTLKEMKMNLEADVLMSMIDVVLQADRSEDGIFSEREIQGLILRLKMLPTIEMNEELFKKELVRITSTKEQLSQLLKLMEQINEDDVPEDQRVFRLKADAMDRIV